MGRGLIIEGVTGAGKSRTLDALSHVEARPDWLRHARVMTEDETLGELMDEELRDASLTDEQRCFRLHAAVRRIDRAFADGASAGFVLERFHFTHFVFMPRWELYANIDQHLADLDFRSVLLTLPETQIERAG